MVKSTASPTIKEAEKFFKRAKNELVGRASIGELASWQDASEAFSKLAGGAAESLEFLAGNISITQEKFCPKNLGVRLYDLQCATIRNLAQENYANKTIQQTLEGTHAEGAVKSEESKEEVAEQRVVEQSNPEPSLGIEKPIPEVAATLLTRTEQRKLHRRYENWYGRIPTEDLQENGGIIPPLQSPKVQSAELLYYQTDAAVTITKKLVVENKRAQLLRAGVGVGKTYMFGQIIRWLWDMKFHEGPVHSLFPYVVVTKATIVTQTERVMKDKFGLPVGKFSGGVMVTNYDQLRANLGDIMMQWHTQVVGGEEVLFPIWRPVIHPCVIVWDECQGLKNEGSTQTQIARAYSEIPDKEITMDQLGKHPTWTKDLAIPLPDNKFRAPNTWQLFSSATPFTTVAEAKTYALATRARVSAESFTGYKGD
jgi:hypothetical protein